jgi:hypothetical protein
MISDINSPNCVKLPTSEFISIHTAKKGVHKKQAKQSSAVPSSVLSVGALEGN